MPSFDDCRTAPFSAPILQTQMPVGVWACVTTASGNIGRIRVSNINGFPGVPIPMTIYLDHTTWALGRDPPPRGPGGGPGGHDQAADSGDPANICVRSRRRQRRRRPGTDFWFQAVNPVQMFIKPLNGAQIAVGNRQNRGYDGCAESFNTAPVPLNTLSAGDYVCAVTNEGRLSQFRINDISSGTPKTLTIRYFTWE